MWRRACFITCCQHKRQQQLSWQLWTSLRWVCFITPAPDRAVWLNMGALTVHTHGSTSEEEEKGLFTPQTESGGLDYCLRAASQVCCQVFIRQHHKHVRYDRKLYRCVVQNHRWVSIKRRKQEAGSRAPTLRCQPSVVLSCSLSSPGSNPQTTNFECFMTVHSQTDRRTNRLQRYFYPDDTHRLTRWKHKELTEKVRHDYLSRLQMWQNTTTRLSLKQWGVKSPHSQELEFGTLV